MQQTLPAISIVIPAYNEALVIDKTIESIKQYMHRFHSERDYEIIVVDDGSTDKTSEKVKRFEDVILLTHKTNLGKGKAVKTGYEKARNKIVVVMDADDSIPIKNIENVWEHLEDYDAVVASRYLNKSAANWPSFFRRMMSRTFSGTVKFLFNLSVSDSQCGFKVFKKPNFDSVFNKVSVYGWAYDVEVLALAAKEGLKVKDFPVVFIPGKRPSKVNYWKTSFQMLSQILKIKIKILFNAYQ
ncbi:MAG: glycosyltransferase family 2 protein [Bacteroidetes bacterium]|nr:MAG: glycosyltransferase family 2 protein [Bacteroidota bacterium]